MKRLNRIDFMGPGHTPVMGWSMAVLSAAALAYTAAHVWSVELDTQTLAQRFKANDLAAVTAAPAMPREALVRVQNPARPRSAALPWSEVLTVFDQHAGARIGLTRFEPDAQDPARLRITARAQDADAVRQFVRTLQTDGRLAQVNVTDQSVESGAGERPVSFTLVAAWRANNNHSSYNHGVQ